MELRQQYWGYNWLYRKLTIYITVMLYPTGISADGVSMLVLIFGSLAGLCAYAGNLYLAILLAYINILLDGVDGEMARLRNKFSLRGVYLDALNHLFVPALFWIGLSARLNLWIGAIAALAWSGLKAAGKLEYKLYVSEYRNNKEKYNLATPHTASQTQEKKISFLRQLLGVRYQFRQLLIALITILIASLLGYLRPVVIIYSLFLITQILEEAYKGFYNIEERVSRL